MKLNDLQKQYEQAQSESELDALDNLLIQSYLTHEEKQIQQDKARLHHLRLQQMPKESLWRRFLGTGFNPVLRLATAAAVLVGGIWMFQPRPTTNSLDYQALTQSYLAEKPPHSTVKKGENTLVEAKNAYQEEQYAAAAVLFKKAIESGEADETGYFYGATSFLYQQKPDFQTAIHYLLHLKNQNDGFETDAVLWYLSLTYVQTGQLTAAQTTLEELIARDFFNIEKAKSLLARLKKVEKKEKK
jgi:tetratricopeptide (TPR) repeat protein